MECYMVEVTLGTYLQSFPVHVGISTSISLKLLSINWIIH